MYADEKIKETLRSRSVETMLCPDLGPCWQWQGYIDPAGYGRLYVAGRQLRTHVVSWLVHNPGSNRGKVVDHRCRNRACCNPAHLELVTHKENSRRIAARGVQVGRLPMLADQQRASILEAHRLGVPQSRIAQHLRLGRSTISKTIHRYGATWPCTRLPIADFLGECWLHESAVCDTSALWSAWQRWCRQRGIDPGTKIAFGRALTAAAKARKITIGRKKIGPKGEQVWAYTGIAISRRSPLCAAS